MRLAAPACLALALLLGLPACAHAPQAPTVDGGPVTLRIAPIELGEGALNGARVTGAWRLEADAPQFGGVSGLLVEGEQVTAVTDQGWWIAGFRGPAGLFPGITMAPMRGTRGQTFTKAAGDAEGLARRSGRLAVSFERDHRVAVHDGRGTLGVEFRDPAMERLSANKGMEALATLPDERLIAIAEGSGPDGFPVFLIDRSGRVETAELPRLSRHQTTGADVGPDGHLYLLQRDFSFLTGVSIRVLRYRLGDDGLPDPRTAETLAAWESASGIDNMEGIAAFGEPGGPVTLWLISDNNFNAIQRTILVELQLD